MPPIREPRHAIISRRALVEGLVLGALAGPRQARARPTSGIRAIAFDAFTIFDSRSPAAAARAMFPEQGERLAAIWSQKLFDYTWIETAADHYQDFETLVAAALRHAAATMGLDLPKPQLEALVASYSALDIWPDAKSTLDRLRGAGIRLALLSNMTDAMLRSNLKHAGLDAEHLLSTDRVRRYKPSPSAYQMAVDTFDLPKEAIGFAAFGGWDAMGASWFGYRTAWINRFGLPAEALGPEPAIVSRGLEGVLQLAGLA